ncbi:MAG: helix-turn-helix domain-containing protein [Candidatus Acidiferrales bacterium]
MPTRTPEHRLGAAIKRRRQAKGLSQEHFAERAGLHRTYVSQLERGLKSPSIRVVTRISAALGCEPWVLIKEASRD